MCIRYVSVSVRVRKSEREEETQKEPVIVVSKRELRTARCEKPFSKG